jgi:hypothetical protein
MVEKHGNQKAKYLNMENKIKTKGEIFWWRRYGK